MASYFVSQSLVAIGSFKIILLPLRWVYTGSNQSLGRKTDTWQLFHLEDFLPPRGYVFVPYSFFD